MYVFPGASPCKSAGLSPAQLFCFSPATSQWVVLPAASPGPPSARANPGLAAAPDGRLYIFGGAVYSSPYVFNDLWRFTPATGAWELLSDGDGAPPSPRGPNCFAAAPDGSFFTYGGYTNSPVAPDHLAPAESLFQLNHADCKKKSFLLANESRQPHQSAAVEWTLKVLEQACLPWLIAAYGPQGAYCC